MEVIVNELLIFDLHKNFNTFIEWVSNYVFLVSIGGTDVIYGNIYKYLYILFLVEIVIVCCL